MSRLIAGLAADAPAALAAVRQARAQAREQVWQLSPQVGPDGSIVVDLDATIVLAHSEKEGATPTWGAHVRVPPAAGVPRPRGRRDRRAARCSASAAPRSTGP